MKDGRIYIWNGRALIFGRSIDSTPHAHFGLQMSIGLQGPFEIALADSRAVETRSRLFLPNENHAISSNGLVLAHLFIDPGHRHVLRFRKQQNAQPVCSHEPLIADLESCWREEWSLDQADVIASRWQSLWLTHLKREPNFDSRIASIMERLSVHDEYIDTNELARSIGLSPSRFIHLFTSQTGLPPRRFLIWRRTLKAAACIVDGMNLTHAAHEAGFSDLAHMSRLFLRTFGVRPSDLTRMSIHVESEQAFMH